MQPNRLARSVESAAPGPAGHESWEFVGRHDFRAKANEHVAGGLEGDQWIQYVGAAPRHQLHAELAGLPVGDRLMARGGWGVSPIEEFYRYRDGELVVDPQRSVAARLQDVDRAVTAGFAGLLIVADATAVVRRPEQVDAFAGYEYLLEQALTTLPASALCAHDRTRVDRDSARGLACLHRVTGPDPMPFRLYAGRAEGFSLAGQLDVASRELMLNTFGRIEAYLAGPELVVDGGDLEFIDHRALLDLASLARRVGADRVVLQTNLRSAKRLSEVLGDERIRVEAAG